MKNNRQVILVAGPAASGKSVPLQKIKNGQCPRLCEQLNIQDPEAWHYTNARDAGNTCLPENNRKLLVHCDLYNRGTVNRIHNLLLTADNITAVTLCLPPQILVNRNKNRMLKNLRLLLKKPPKHKKHKNKVKKLSSLWRRQKRNMNEEKVLEAYNNWFDLVDQHPATTYWLDSSAIDNPIAHLYEGDRSDALQMIKS